VVTHQLQVEREQGKIAVRRSQTDILPLCHATTGGSMRRGQRTFRPDNKEDRHICLNSHDTNKTSQ